MAEAGAVVKQDDPMRVWLTRLSLGAGVAFTATAEYQLARALGANTVIAAMLPVAIDAYVIAALRWFRAFDILLSLSLMGAAQISAHLLDAHVMRVNIPMVVVVSLLVPAAIWRTHALARRTDTPVPAVPEAAKVGEFHPPAEVSNFVDNIHEVPADPEPVPVPEVRSDTAYPELPAVPETPEDDYGRSAIVKVDAELPTATQSSATPADLRESASVLVADQQRVTRLVHAEYVPVARGLRIGPDGPEPDEPEDGDDSPPPPALDRLTPRARADFADDLNAGRTPPIRALRDTYSIGQVRAQRIQKELGTP